MIMDLLIEMDALLTEAKENAEKFYGKKNATAGTRLRNNMQEIKNLAQKVRVDVSEVKNS